MITLFNIKKRLLWFPIRWANSVATWIMNIRSPDGSIKVRNTCLPKDGDSLALSIDRQWLSDFIRKTVKDLSHEGQTSAEQGREEQKDNEGESTLTVLDSDSAADGAEPDAAWQWQNGSGGLRIDCYFEAAEENGYHYLRRATLTFGKKGTLLSAVCDGTYKEIKA